MSYQQNTSIIENLMQGIITKLNKRFGGYNFKIDKTDNANNRLVLDFNDCTFCNGKAQSLLVEKKEYVQAVGVSFIYNDKIIDSAITLTDFEIGFIPYKVLIVSENGFNLVKINDQQTNKLSEINQHPFYLENEDEMVDYIVSIIEKWIK